MQNHCVLCDKFSNIVENNTVFQKTGAKALREASRGGNGGEDNPLAFNQLSKNPIRKALVREKRELHLY